ncbi:hypothetical protein GCM10023403_60310 [Pseudonocardia benzenivorans]
MPQRLLAHPLGEAAAFNGWTNSCWIGTPFLRPVHQAPRADVKLARLRTMGRSAPGAVKRAYLV